MFTRIKEAVKKDYKGVSIVNVKTEKEGVIYEPIIGANGILFYSWDVKDIRAVKALAIKLGYKAKYREPENKSIHCYEVVVTK